MTKRDDYTKNYFRQDWLDAERFDSSGEPPKSPLHSAWVVRGAMAMSAHARVALAAPAARCVSTPSRAAAAPARAFAARAPVRARAARKTQRLAAARAFAPRDVPEASMEPPLVEPSVVAELDARSPSVAFLSVSLAVLANAAHDTAAFAAEGYQGIGVPDDEATPLQNAFGALFTVFCGWYFLRVVKKRGNRAKEFRVANTLPVREETVASSHRERTPRARRARASFYPFLRAPRRRRFPETRNTRLTRAARDPFSPTHRKKSARLATPSS